MYLLLNAIRNFFSEKFWLRWNFQSGRHHTDAHFLRQERLSQYHYYVIHYIRLNLISANGERIFYTFGFFFVSLFKKLRNLKKIRFSVVHQRKVTSSSAAVSLQVGCKIWNQFCKSRSFQDFICRYVCAVNWVSLQRPSHHKLYHIVFSLHLKFYTELIKIGFAQNKRRSHDPFSFR
jgi:hypothetical protein